MDAVDGHPRPAADSMPVDFASAEVTNPVSKTTAAPAAEDRQAAAHVDEVTKASHRHEEVAGKGDAQRTGDEARRRSVPAQTEAGLVPIAAAEGASVGAETASAVRVAEGALDGGSASIVRVCNSDSQAAAAATDVGGSAVGAAPAPSPIPPTASVPPSEYLYLSSTFVHQKLRAFAPPCEVCRGVAS
jgi:hypothetical protein